MIFHVIAASCCRQMELMTRNVKTTPGGGKSAIKFVTGVFHTIFLEYRLQAAFVKGPVVGHKRQTFDSVSNLCPHFRECRLPVSVVPGETVNLSSPVCIVIRGELNKTIKSINYLTTSHDYYTDAAHAGASAIGCFKIYCYEVLYCLFISKWLYTSCISVGR